jgi:transcriptional regulator with XRE-family HTH domain
MARSEKGIPSSFSALLRRHRQLADRSQEELAKLAGISTRAVNDLETGTTLYPHDDTVQRLATALKLDDETRKAFVAAVPERPRTAATSRPQPHNGEEALIKAEPRAAIIQDALYDELCPMGSTIDNRAELLAELRAAVQALSPGTAATGLKLPPITLSGEAGLSEEQALAALRHVRGAVNDIRDSSRKGLVRVRNRLCGATFLTGLLMCAMFAIAINQPHPPGRDIISAVVALFLVGAIVGLVNRLYVDFQADQAVEDYGLSVARLISIALLSGLVAVFGVALSVLLPTAIAPTSVPTQQHISPLVAAYDLNKYAMDPFIAAIYGLTPNLLLSRLDDLVAKLKTNISSTDLMSLVGRR